MAALSYIKNNKRKKTVVILFCFFIILVYFGYYFFALSHKFITQNTSTLKTSSVTITQQKGTMKITSPAFINNTSIPVKYTCDGEGINPPFEFLDVPSNAKSLVLLMYDPDVPKKLYPSGVFVHWVV